MLIKTQIIQYLKIAPNAGKIPELDGIRAIAIILVLLRHFIISYQEYHYLPNIIDSSSVLLNPLKNGWLGVDLFFVLSGFLITRHLIAIQWSVTTKVIFTFYLKRVFRTFPLYFSIIALVALEGIPLYIPYGTIDTDSLVIHSIFMQDYYGATILVSLWSLATEEKFYLLSPLLLLILSKVKPQKIIIYLLLFILSILFIKVGLVLLENNLTYNGYFWLFRAPFHFAFVGILIGVATALISRNGVTKAIHHKHFFGCIAFLCLSFFLMNWGNQEDWWKSSINTFFVTLAFGYLIYYCSTYSNLKRLKILRSKFLRIISVLSYSLYLTHLTILPLTNEIITQLNLSLTALHIAVYFFVYILLSSLFSLILHYFVEKPFLILKNRL